MRHRPLLACLAVALVFPALLAWVGPDRTVSASSAPAAPPPVHREFRGAWVAAVSNIDWPSRPGMPVEAQKAELLTILDRLVELRMNAIVLQVRPAADALYQSAHEPWSYYLTGRQGRAPTPSWDPLAFAIEEAHRRGLELHAWFNPFRAFHPSGARGDTARTHVARTNRGFVRRYGNQLWMDPGDPAVRRRSLDVISDVVRRYDIDAVHLDDYFYPYRVENRRGYLQFPDEETYARYRRNGGKLARDDWRRDNVNQFVRALYEQVHTIKPHVRVGISPFGIWRPGDPAGIVGLDAYQEIFADSRLWLREGWVDYFAPQLYWHPDAEKQSFSRLLEWWGASAQNPHDRHIWAGLYTSRIVPGETNPRWRPDAVMRQIAMARDDAVATGHIHFSMRALLKDPDGIATQLQGSAYRDPALVPASPWLEAPPPGTPAVRLSPGAQDDGWRIELQPAGGASPWQWTIQYRDDTQGWQTRIIPGAQRALEIGPATGMDAVWVTAVNRIGVQSPLVRALVPGTAQ